MPMEGLENIIRYMRSQTARVLDARELAGEEISADPHAGRHCRCWLHHAQVPGVRPVVFEVHGGGFCMGDARKGDALREWICRSFDVNVVGVDYRLTPEHPAPAALDDVLATMEHFAREDYRYDVDRGAFYLLGFSAGATLSMAACCKAQGRDSLNIRGQALHYPFFDAYHLPDPAAQSPLGVPYEMSVAFNAWYVADGDAKSYEISPIFASDDQLRCLPFTTMYAVSGDPLADQAAALGGRMQSLGCDMAWHEVQGAYHGYIEDAENIDLYRAITLPTTIESRPAGFQQVAADQLKCSLEELLGPVKHKVAFPGLKEAHGD